MWPRFGQYNNNVGIGLGFLSIISILAIVDLVLKAIALWKASKNDQKYWFIAILIINSLGILPLVYIYFFQKNGKKAKRKKAS